MSRGNWTEADIGDQTGRTALVTGANSGIGYEAARALAEHGAHVVLACRNPERAAEAEQQINSLSPKGDVEVLELDLGDLDSVADGADEFLGRHDHLDLLINNAGLMATPKGTTAQGFETQFGVNHLGHFALTAHLLPTVMDTPDSRVVTVSSLAHHMGRINFDDLNSSRRYSPWEAYCQSKLANLLFTLELQRRLEAVGSDTLSVAAHPGGSSTNLGSENSGGIAGALMQAARPLVEMAFQSAAMGALPTLRAAVDPSATGGKYYGPNGFMEQQGHPRKVRTSVAARSRRAAKRLWDVSAESTGVDFPTL